MKIVILGSQGSLGQALTYSLQEHHEVVPLARFNADITDLQTLHNTLKTLKPDCIINCAAINFGPDSSKKNSEELLFQVNTIGAANIAAFASENNVKFIQISCASVIAGSKDKTEKAGRAALEVVGESKKEAEEIIEKIYGDSKNYIILRCGLLFGEYGHSLVNHLERLIKKKTQIAAVDDIIYSLTATKLLAEYIGSLLEEDFKGEILHCAHPEKFSVAEFAELLTDKRGKEIKIKKTAAESVGEVAGDFSLEMSEEFESIQKYLV